MTGVIIIVALVLALLGFSVAMLIYFMIKINKLYDSVDSIKLNEKLMLKKLTNNVDLQVSELKNSQINFYEDLNLEITSTLEKDVEDEYYLQVKEALELLEKNNADWFSYHFPNGIPSLDKIKEVVDGSWNEEMLAESSILED